MHYALRSTRYARPSPQHPTLSVCLIVRDESQTLPRCLSSLGDLPHEIIVVDTGSTDDTVAVARRLGAKVYHFPWRDDFAAARNESLRHATGDWVLWLDADFELHPGHEERIRRAIASGQADAYWVHVHSLLAGGQLEEWGRLPMLFRNRPGIRFEGAVHEQVLPSLLELGMEPVPSDIVFEHRGYVDPATVRAKAARNLPALLKQWQQDPHDPVHNYHLGQAYVALERYDEAVAAFERVLAQTDTPPHLRANAYAAALGVTTALLTDTARALRLAAAARREFPDYPFLRYMVGLAEAGACRWQEAVTDLTQALERMTAAGAPGTPEAAGAPPGATQFRRVDPAQIQEALQACREALAESGRSPTADRRPPTADQRPRTEDERSTQYAVRSTQHAVRNAHHELRIPLDRLDAVTPPDREKALAQIPVLEAAARQRPDDPQTLAALGRAYAIAGRYDDAVVALQRALEIDPALPEGYYTLGMCYQLRGDVLEALRAYERQVELDPQHDRSWNNLGTLYGLYGNHQRALECFQRAAALNPGDESVQQNLALARQMLDAVPPVVFFGSEATQYAIRSTHYAVRNTQYAVRSTPTLSLCMIVKNEAHNLPDCLASLEGLPDEIIIVDTGSTDDTVAVARRLGARVYHFPWRDDFAAARNESLRHATCDWILWFDADFRLAPGHAERIRRAVASGLADAYWINVRSTFRRGIDARSEWNPLLMLFRNGQGTHFEGAIHEQVVLGPGVRNRRALFTDIVVDHLGYADPQLTRAKAHRNLVLLEKCLVEDPNDLHARFQYVQTLSFLKRHREVLQETPRLLASPRLSPAARYLTFLFQVHARLDLQDYEGALADLTEGEKLFPNDRYLMCLAYRAHRGRGNWEAAAEALQQALACPAQRLDSFFTQEVSDAYLHALLGEAYMSLGRAEEAAFHLREAVNGGWLWPDTALRCGRVLLLLGDPATARDVLRRSLEETPRWIELGVMSERMLGALLEALAEACHRLSDEDTLRTVTAQAARWMPEAFSDGAARRPTTAAG